MRKAKRIFSILLALVVVFGSVKIPMAVHAADVEGMTFSQDRMYYTDGTLKTAPKTYEAVVKFPANYTDRAGVVIGNYFGGKNAASLEIYTNGRPRLYTVVDNTAYSYIFNANVCTGDWVHIAITQEVDTWTCYINGVKTDETTYSAPYFNAEYQASLVLGGDHRYSNGAYNTEYFKGQMKSVTLFSDVRTADEIAKDAVSYDKTSDNVLLHYDMSNLSSDVEVVPDLSGNGMNASFERWVEPADKEPVKDYDFSFAVVGDTQCINDTEKLKVQQLDPLYNWIRDNVESKNIKYVMGLGDITENQNADEWNHAVENIRKLDGLVSYSLIRGNHDHSDSKPSFTSQFDYNEYTNQIGGRYQKDSLNNVWMKFSIGEVNYLVLALDYGAEDAVLTWAGDVIEDHPNHNVIVTTHGYLYRDGTTLDAGNELAVPSPNNGNKIWDNLVSQYENIVLVLSGHDPYNDIVVTQREGVNGNTVTEMLIDPQGMDKNMGPTGMVAMFYFSNGGRTLQLEYYSTIRDQYWPESRIFNLDLVGICDHENVTEHIAVEPTCTTVGNTAYTVCDDCGEVISGKNEVIPMLSHTPVHYERVDATPTQAGNIEYWECSECTQKFSDEACTKVVTVVEIPQLGTLEINMSGASVILDDGVAVNFKVAKSAIHDNGYTNPYMRVKFQNVDAMVLGVEKGENYEFTFDNIAPHQMNDEMEVILCASANGVSYASDAVAYSVGTYCYNMLAKEESSDELKDLLVKLLNYGAAAQTYQGYRTDALVNKDLSSEQQEVVAPDLGAVTQVDTVEKAVTWKSATLVLKDTVTLRFKVNIGDKEINKLSVVVKNASDEVYDGCTTRIQRLSDKEYYIFVEGLTFTEMETEIKLTINEEVEEVDENGDSTTSDVAVSKTLNYSIATYAAKKMDNSNLGMLMKAMMNFGQSAVAYKNSL